MRISILRCWSFPPHKKNIPKKTKAKHTPEVTKELGKIYVLRQLCFAWHMPRLPPMEYTLWSEGG